MRCACGYPAEYHLDGRCPLCACGVTAGEHVAAWVIAPPLLAARTELRCPGKGPSAAGKLPTLRRGTFREPPPGPRYEHRPGWGTWLWPVIEPDVPAEPASGPQSAPRVPARYTVSLDEIARSAMALGELAAGLGWKVDPWYHVAADGTETSALVMSRGDLRAGATWERRPGATWRTAVAYALPSGQWPVKVGVKRLAEIITELGGDDVRCEARAGDAGDVS